MTRFSAFLVFALAAACSDKSASRDGDPCFSNNECDGNACFLGRCVDSGFGISSVSIDAQPSKASGALRQRVMQTIDASAGSQTITLAPTITIGGSVMRGGKRIDGDLTAQLVTAGNCQPATADNAITYTGSNDRRGFNLAVVPGVYRVTFTPEDDDPTLPPLTYPDDGSCGVTLAQGIGLNLTYSDTLTPISGRLRYSASDTTGVAGAQIIARTVDIRGVRYESAMIETGQDGAFVLALPKAGESYTLSVRGGSNSNVPTVTLPNVTRGTDGSVGDLTLGISAPVAVQVLVVGPDGAPVNDVTVTAIGSVGGGTLSVSGATAGANANAGVVNLSARAGDFTIQAAPRRSVSAGIASRRITLVEANAAKLTITLPAQASVAGTVRSADGVAVSNAKVTFHLTNTTTSDRDVTATTVQDGSYSVMVDALDAMGNAAEHEITVDPATDSREPRLRELIRIESSTVTHDINLFSASFFYGTVVASDGTALPATALLFYSSDFGGSGPLLVGVSQSDTLGEFAVPLPQPNAGQ